MMYDNFNLYHKSFFGPEISYLGPGWFIGLTVLGVIVAIVFVL